MRARLNLKYCFEVDRSCPLPSSIEKPLYVPQILGDEHWLLVTIHYRTWMPWHIWDHGVRERGFKTRDSRGSEGWRLVKCCTNSIEGCRRVTSRVTIVLALMGASSRITSDNGHDTGDRNLGYDLENTLRMHYPRVKHYSKSSLVSLVSLLPAVAFEINVNFDVSISL